jgi:hypothetical protein
MMTYEDNLKSWEKVWSDTEYELHNAVAGGRSEFGSSPENAALQRRYPQGALEWCRIELFPPCFCQFHLLSIQSYPLPPLNYRPWSHSSTGILMGAVQLPHFILQLLYLPQVQFVIQVGMYAFLEKLCSGILFCSPIPLAVQSKAEVCGRCLPGKVQSSPGTWMCISCKALCVVSRGLCNRLITRPEGYYQAPCVFSVIMKPQQ